MDKIIIAEEMTQCLNKHGLTFTEKMVTKYVDIWEAAKSPLIDILRNHPNWNEEQMAVSFDYDTAYCR